MKYAEACFKDGTKSVVSYEDENELKGLQARLAITSFNLYDKHPGVSSGMLSSELVNACVEICTKDGKVDVFELIRELRVSLSPLSTDRSESNYKTTPVGVL